MHTITKKKKKKEEESRYSTPSPLKAWCTSLKLKHQVYGTIRRKTRKKECVKLHIYLFRIQKVKPDRASGSVGHGPTNITWNVTENHKVK